MGYIALKNLKLILKENRQERAARAVAKKGIYLFIYFAADWENFIHPLKETYGSPVS